MGGGGGGIGKRPILYIGKRELRGLLEKSAAAAAACCCSNDDETLVLLIATGGVDDDGVSGLSGVGERERRDIGERDRDLDEPDEDALDDIDDDDDGDRLIDVFVLCDVLVEDDDDVDGTRPTFAKSGRGAGSKVFSDNVLAVEEETNRVCVCVFYLENQ